MKSDPAWKEPFYRRGQLRFSCTRCGRCCAGGPGEQVFLFAGEAERIRTHLDVSPAWFRRRYLSRFEGDQVLRLNEDGSCVFLGPEGCRVYEARPLQCRSYPFWPEVIKNRKNWLSERSACEGIDRGEVVEVPVIEHWLRQLARAFENSEQA